MPEDTKIMSKKKSQFGFTLVELLVVISVIALLLSIMMPALNQAKEIARAVVCAAQMRVYGTAVNLYANEWDNYFPRYAAHNNQGVDISDTRRDLTWFNLLAPDVGGVTISKDDPRPVMLEKDLKNYFADFRQCPSGIMVKSIADGHTGVWIGVNYGGVADWGDPIPWLWRRLNDPGIKIYDFRSPARCISFLDTRGGWGLYSPGRWKFSWDSDGDGKNDTYVGGSPITTVHRQFITVNLI